MSSKACTRCLADWPRQTEFLPKDKHVIFLIEYKTKAVVQVV